MIQKLSAGADARWRLGGQGEVELLEQDFVIGLRVGVATQDQGPAIGGGEMHIEHLNGRAIPKLQLRILRKSSHRDVTVSPIESNCSRYPQSSTRRAYLAAKWYRMFLI